MNPDSGLPEFGIPRFFREPDERSGDRGDFKKGPRATRYVNRKIGDNQISRKTEPEISAENQIRIIPGMINNTRYGILATLR